MESIQCPVRKSKQLQHRIAKVLINIHRTDITFTVQLTRLHFVSACLKTKEWPVTDLRIGHDLGPRANGAPRISSLLPLITNLKFAKLRRDTTSYFTLKRAKMQTSRLDPYQYRNNKWQYCFSSEFCSVWRSCVVASFLPVEDQPSGEKLLCERFETEALASLVPNSERFGPRTKNWMRTFTARSNSAKGPFQWLLRYWGCYALDQWFPTFFISRPHFKIWYNLATPFVNDISARPQPLTATLKVFK